MATFKINNFMGGLNQSADDGELAANESRNAQNVEIASGTLKTVRGFKKHVPVAVPAGVTRLMKFYQTSTSTGDVTSHLLAATASAIYRWDGAAWSAIGSGFTSGDWDFLNYQINETDVIIMGNGEEPVKKWDGTTLSNLGGTPPKMKSITVHAERVWGTGVKAFPNSIYYSDDLNPENWTGGVDASGEIYLPTWDGGACIGVSNIFSDLVIFKTNNIYRVLGTYPAVYEVKQVYSSVGAIAERTIVSGGDKAFFLSKDGLYYYNGVSAYPMLGDKAKDVIINPAYAQNAVSIIYKNTLYCAFPEGESTENNAVFVCDLLNNTLMLLRGVSATDFMEYEDKLLFTNATGFVYQVDAEAVDFDGERIVSFWETPWQDLDAFRALKTADTLYLYAQGNGMLSVSVSFDKKTKTKQLALSPNGKLHEISLSLEGRRFKLKFANVSGSYFELTAPELTYEADED